MRRKVDAATRIPGPIDEPSKDSDPQPAGPRGDTGAEMCLTYNTVPLAPGWRNNRHRRSSMGPDRVGRTACRSPGAVVAGNEKDGKYGL